MERTLETKEIYNGKIVKLRVDKVELPNGNTSSREIVEHPGAVCILPLKEDGRVVLVNQFRKPIEKILLELPAGKLEKGEKPEACAVRELTEETGYRAGKMEYIFSFYTTPGFSNEILHLFLATELIPGECNPDGDEMVEVVEIELGELVDMITKGEIKDSKTIMGILALQNRR